MAYQNGLSRPSCCAISCGAMHPFNERFAFLYNSYYEAEEHSLSRSWVQRADLLTRPSLDRDPRLPKACQRGPDAGAQRYLPAPALELVMLGCHHEEQHQELLLTDLLHLFAQNPLLPAASAAPRPARPQNRGARWIEGREGRVRHRSRRLPGFPYKLRRPAPRGLARAAPRLPTG